MTRPDGVAAGLERLHAGTGGFVVRAPDDLRRLHVAVIAGTSSGDYPRRWQIDYCGVGSSNGSGSLPRAATMTRSRSESSLKSDSLSVKTEIASLTALMLYR